MNRSTRNTPHARVVDVVVIGGGPSGVCAALAFAQRGARVLLLDAAPSAAGRLAGEWMHPPGAHILATLGLGTLTKPAYPTGCGLAVLPDDDSAPISLPYPDGAHGFGLEHRVLVQALREAAMAQAGVSYVAGGRARAMEAGRLTYSDPTTGEQTVHVGRVVGADGRTSSARQWLGLPARFGSQVSAMAGVTLEGAELPFEGFGHVLLGGPGPVLVYRIGADRLRACLDIPLCAPRGPSAARYLWESYQGAFPPQLRAGFRSALLERPVAWAANRVAQRACYGRADLALIGDAVGHTHPLTAVGMTLGLLDANCLSRAPTFTAYRRERAADSIVSEWLASAMYEVFTRRDAGSLALRHGMYRLWRTEPRARDDTMRLLSTADVDPGHFGRVFLQVMGLATVDLLPPTWAVASWARATAGLVGLGRWASWLASRVLPGLIRFGSLGASQQLERRGARVAARQRLGLRHQ